MARVCFVVVAGLDAGMMKVGEGLATLGSFKHRTVYKPAFPAVTSTAQATLTTGGTAGEHGIVCNGLYTFGKMQLHENLDLSNHAESRKQVSFWEQSNALLQRPRYWEGTGKKVAMLFWQQSMRAGGGATEIVLTPKPTHTADGKTLAACFSSPAELYPELVRKLGPFPLHQYWSPMAGLGSSQWIVKAAVHVWEGYKPDIELVYLPHLDYNLQRLGPSHPQVRQDVAEVDGVLAVLAAKVRGDGGTLVVAGDYGMFDVATPVMPNVALREAGLLAVKKDEAGKVVVDFAESAAFAMADHQVAYVYVKPGRAKEALEVLTRLAGVARILATADEMAEMGVNSVRSGELVLMARPDAWFGHDWWLAETEKPAWQFGVDIHNKPGFDPRELFFDPAKKWVQQDARVVRGSHGLVHDAGHWPVVMADVELPSPEAFSGTLMAGWLARLGEQ